LAVIFSGKAAPGYFIAKAIIKLINNVGQKINYDPDTADFLKCVFIPNYNVSLAGMPGQIGLQRLIGRGDCSGQ
jgi:glucan phosphorylase